MAQEGQDRAPGYVYLIAGPDGLYKLGRSIDPLGRLLQIAPKGAGLKLLDHFPTGNMVWLEKYLHQAFSHRRVKLEWFRLTGEDVKLILSIRAADGLDDLPSAIAALHALNAANGFVWGERDDSATVLQRAPTLQLRMPEDLYSALVSWVEAQDVPPPITRVILVAVDRFLKAEGLT